MIDIIGLLQLNDKMTSAQIASALNIAAREVITGLLDLEKHHAVMQVNGFWSVYTKSKQHSILSVKILDIIKQWEVMSAAEISSITGASRSSVTHSLTEHVKSERMLRHRKDSVYFYKMTTVTS